VTETYLYRCPECGYWSEETTPFTHEDHFCCPNEVPSDSLGDLIHYGRQVYTGCDGVLELWTGTKEALNDHP